MIIEKIVFSETQPRFTTVLWIKPTEAGQMLYIFNNGRWQPLQLIDDKGTPNTNDDEAIDVAEIIRIMGLSLQDSSDTTDYPESII